MKRLFTGGRVVSGSAVVAADVLVDGEKIVSVAPHIDAPDAEVVDVTGKLLLPGFIDAHTHFDLDVCNTTTADDFESGSRSALRGRHHHRHRLRLPQQRRDAGLRLGAVAQKGGGLPL